MTEERLIYILLYTSRNEEDSENIIAVSHEKQEITTYQEQEDIKDSTVIEERSFKSGWMDSIKYMNEFIVKCNGKLRTQMQVNIAETRKQSKLQKLKASIELLSELQDEADPRTRAIYKAAKEALERNFNEVQESELEFDSKKELLFY